MKGLMAVAMAAAMGALHGAPMEDAATLLSRVAAARPTASASPRAVALKLSPVAHSRNATLADLVDGPLPADLGALVVKPGLVAGSDVDVDSALVALKLRQGAKDGWRLSPAAPTSVRLKVPLLRVPADDLRRFASDFILGRLSGTPGVTVEPRGTLQPLNLFDAPLRLRVRLPEGLALRGPVTLRVDAWQDDERGDSKLSASVPVSFMIRRQEGRLYATRGIRRGEGLGPEDLTLRQDETTFNGDGIGDMDSVRGKVARTFIPEGQAISPSMVDEPVAIRQGDVVRLMVRSGNVVVETSAKALRDARIGESIPLQVLDTDRPVQARCVEAGVAVRETP